MQPGKRVVKLCIRLIFFQQCFGRLFVNDTRSAEFLILRVFYIPQQENKRTAFSRRNRYRQVMAADRRPSVGNAVRVGARKYCFRVVKALTSAAENTPAGIKSADGSVYGKYRIMVPALPVFRLMLNDTASACYFHLSG